MRKTLDWLDEDVFWAEVDPRVRPRAELWNETFNIPYHRFRHRVRQIAELNHSRVEGAVPSEWDDIPDGALVLPVDDDDWFSPDAARILESEVEPDVRGYLWASRWIEVPTTPGHRLYLIRRRLLPWTPPKWICTTNNYGMLKDPDAKPMLAHHVIASEWFESRVRNGTAAGVKRIDRELGVANRTLASMTSLRVLAPRQPFDRPQLVRKFRRYKRLYREFEAPGLDWCRPYVAMMADLMDELSLKHAA